LFRRWHRRRRHAAIRRWSERLLFILCVKRRCVNRPARFPERCLLVLNHISWLDIFLVDATHPAMFVAKSEIRDWPVAGALVTRVGTLYLERGRAAAARRTNRRIEEALTEGHLVACFPEGTTSSGESVGRFHGALFQPAIDADAVIQPVVLRYRERSGERTRAPAYVGDDSLLKCVWNIASTPCITAELLFLKPVRAGMRNRRELAQELRALIQEELDKA
jgi:1-acyl-sn-glycerol-3-phosphate acyltransferase